MTRKLNINLDDLAVALDSSGSETGYYLDMETGGLFMLSPDIEYAMKQIREIMKQQATDFETALAGSDLADWLREEVHTAYRIEIKPSRYLPMQPTEPFAGYGDMAAFIETVADDRLAAKLASGIRSKGAFRHFKNILLNYPQERARWFDFQAERQRRRALEFLANNDIEPL